MRSYQSNDNRSWKAKSKALSHKSSDDSTTPAPRTSRKRTCPKTSSIEGNDISKISAPYKKRKITATAWQQSSVEISSAGNLDGVGASFHQDSTSPGSGGEQNRPNTGNSTTSTSKSYLSSISSPSSMYQDAQQHSSVLSGLHNINPEYENHLQENLHPTNGNQQIRPANANSTTSNGRPYFGNTSPSISMSRPNSSYHSAQQERPNHSMTMMGATSALMILSSGANLTYHDLNHQQHHSGDGTGLNDYLLSNVNNTIWETLLPTSGNGNELAIASTPALNQQTAAAFENSSPDTGSFSDYGAHAAHESPSFFNTNAIYTYANNTPANNANASNTNSSYTHTNNANANHIHLDANGQIGTFRFDPAIAWAPVDFGL